MKPIHRRVIFHFTDTTTLALEWPKQETQGFTFLSEAIRKALESRQLMIEVEGNFVVIPMNNLKYIELVPAPEQLPQGVIREARYVTNSVGPTEA